MFGWLTDKVITQEFTQVNSDVNNLTQKVGNKHLLSKKVIKLENMCDSLEQYNGRMNLIRNLTTNKNKIAFNFFLSKTL